MHEFSMMSQVVEKVLEEAGRRGAKRVKEVEVLVGELTLLNHEQLKFSYQVLVKGTVMEGSRLVLRSLEGEVECPECGFKGRPSYDDSPSLHLAPLFLCPRCGSLVKVLKGRELIVKRIRIEV